MNYQWLFFSLVVQVVHIPCDVCIRIWSWIKEEATKTLPRFFLSPSNISFNLNVTFDAIFFADQDDDVIKPPLVVKLTASAPIGNHLPLLPELNESMVLCKNWRSKVRFSLKRLLEGSSHWSEWFVTFCLHMDVFMWRQPWLDLSMFFFAIFSLNIFVSFGSFNGYFHMSHALSPETFIIHALVPWFLIYMGLYLDGG